MYRYNLIDVKLIYSHSHKRNCFCNLLQFNIQLSESSIQDIQWTQHFFLFCKTVKQKVKYRGSVENSKAWENVSYSADIPPSVKTETTLCVYLLADHEAVSSHSRISSIEAWTIHLFFSSLKISKKKVEIIHLSIANAKEKSKHIEGKNISLQFPVNNQHYTKHKSCNVLTFQPFLKAQFIFLLYSSKYFICFLSFETTFLEYNTSVNT